MAKRNLICEGGVGTADEANVVATYTDNGLVHTVTDAENNKTTYAYDGHDRLARTYFPLPAKGSGQSATPQNTAEPDYEELVYESLAGGARTSNLVASFRNRAGETTAFTYDALGRLTVKDRPGAELDLTYGYDLLGRTIRATHFYSITFDYDALGRRLTEESPHGIVASEYDLAGRRTKLTHPDGFFVDYDHLVTGEVEKIRENGATSGVGVLATFAYDDLGRRDTLTYGNGAVTDYDYDSVSRLTTLAHDTAGTGNEVGFTMAYNPAGQIVARSGAWGVYAWTGHGSGSTASPANGLNQLTALGSAAVTHDTRGNTTAIGAASYAYTSDNLMVSAPGASLYYDPLDRLRFVSGGGNEQFKYDGDELIVEYDYYGTSLVRRYVHGPGTDEPLVWYEGSGTSGRRFLHADERGSIIGAYDSSGAATGYSAYDEYGRPQRSWNPGRFGYTGQAWLPELGLYYYKARIYWPSGGRFMQPDPIGYGDGMNPYLYARGDPVNLVDPSGTQADDEEGVISTGIPARPAKPGGERIWDWMGIYGRPAGGRLEAMRFERQQADLRIALLALERSTDPDRYQKSICLTPIECARELRDALVRLQKKPKAPHDPPRRGEFASAAGFERSLKKSEAALNKPFNTEQIIRNLRDAHFTKQDVYNWAVFYSISYERDHNNSPEGSPQIMEISVGAGPSFILQADLVLHHGFQISTRRVGSQWRLDNSPVHSPLWFIFLRV